MVNSKTMHMLVELSQRDNNVTSCLSTLHKVIYLEKRLIKKITAYSILMLLLSDGIIAITTHTQCYNEMYTYA